MTKTVNNKKTKTELSKWTKSCKSEYSAEYKDKNLHLELSVWSEDSSILRGKYEWYLHVAPKYAEAHGLSFSTFRTKRDALAYAERMFPPLVSYFRALTLTQLEASAPFTADAQKSGIYPSWTSIGR